MTTSSTSNGIAAKETAMGTQGEEGGCQRGVPVSVEVLPTKMALAAITSTKTGMRIMSTKQILKSTLACHD